jgi:hypothetical protein
MNDCNFLDYYLRYGSNNLPFNNCNLNSPNTVIVDFNVSCSNFNGLRVFPDLTLTQNYLLQTLPKSQSALIIVIPYTSPYPAFSLIRNNTTIIGLSPNEVVIDGIHVNTDAFSISNTNRISIKSLSCNNLIIDSPSYSTQSIFCLLSDIIVSDKLTILNNNENFNLVLENSLINTLNVLASPSQLIFTNNFIETLKIENGATVISSNDALGSTSISKASVSCSNIQVRANPFSTNGLYNSITFDVYDDANLSVNNAAVKNIEINSTNATIIIKDILTSSDQLSLGSNLIITNCGCSIKSSHTENTYISMQNFYGSIQLSGSSNTIISEQSYFSMMIMTDTNGFVAMNNTAIGSGTNILGSSVGKHVIVGDSLTINAYVSNGLTNTIYVTNAVTNAISSLSNSSTLNPSVATNESIIDWTINSTTNYLGLNGSWNSAVIVYGTNEISYNEVYSSTNFYTLCTTNSSAWINGSAELNSAVIYAKNAYLIDGNLKIGDLTALVQDLNITNDLTLTKGTITALSNIIVDSGNLTYAGAGTALLQTASFNENNSHIEITGGDLFCKTQNYESVNGTWNVTNGGISLEVMNNSRIFGSKFDLATNCYINMAFSTNSTNTVLANLSFINAGNIVINGTNIGIYTNSGLTVDIISQPNSNFTNTGNFILLDNAITLTTNS